MSSLLYAVYGSNLLRERFIYYIEGGKFRGEIYNGCRDKTLPVDSGSMTIPYRLYFAKHSSSWENKGVAFLDHRLETDENYFVRVRLWQISEDQFRDIQEQEGDWYPDIIDLGKQDGLRIKTITGEHIDEKNRPSESYLSVIRQGLMETLGWDINTSNEYLSKFL
ncbi:TPA: hypothetical protein DCW38_07350 [candidate division WOR-3 bacterium]|jgi:hypothetical protein|uniref:Gamma-glutamylcyclotransferase n=1 Tax=candidate division WOR-3 bacterium TaxID=2052148 RepID=A0A350HBQ9_UNCW3|nr:hypothetical protein [candidate division WOR-3 bacterium]